MTLTNQGKLALIPLDPKCFDKGPGVIWEVFDGKKKSLKV